MNASPTPRRLGNAILAAAMTLPCLQAQADAPPEHGQISYRYLDYRESQPDADRISVKAHALAISAPLNESWSLDGSLTTDTVSGASPAWWTRNLNAMHDRRNAGDVTLTHYMPHDTVGVNASLSRENDYDSRSLSVSGSHSSEDKNTTWHYGVGGSADTITSMGLDENKDVVNVLLGITQVVSSQDIVQANLTYASGHGYYSDPYKLADNRPRNRHQTAWLTRWNHHLEELGHTLHLHYRYYRDDWGVQAHTLGAEYVVPLNEGWTLTPSLRLHVQDKADFYVDEANFPSAATYHSQDQRLSAFGAATLGLKLAKQLTEWWSADVKLERYEQRGAWYLGGQGSPGLADFRATFLQLGLTRKF